MDRLIADRPADWIEDLPELSTRFHAGIVTMAANPILAGLIGSIRHISTAQRSFRAYDTEELHISHLHHAQVLAAIEQGDAQLANVAMQTHLLAARLATPRP